MQTPVEQGQNIINGVDDNPAGVLSTAPPEHPAMDYAFLRQEGVRHLERLAGQLWTDFNAHDPGITILEQLCYALTDLAYRINYEVPDLLTGSEGTGCDSLYSAAQILTCRPVTLDDLRRVVIDVEGVKNAWVETVDAQEIPLYFQAGEREDALSLEAEAPTAEPIYLKGLYRVLVELSDQLYAEGTAAQRQAVLKRVTRRLHARRGLGEDFEAIGQLEAQAIQVQARIEIEATENAEAILLEIYQRLGAYISPPVRFSTLSQLLAAGQRVDQIFDGPRLEHGFIEAEALSQAQRRTVLRTSDLIREIMDVTGVRTVRTISLAAGGAPEGWSLRLDRNKAAKLDLSASEISLERNQLAVSVDERSVEDAYYEGLSHSAALHRRALEAGDLGRPRGRDRNVRNYSSLQHQFPATYGIGAMGLPDSASPQREAQAKQLKAYLMFFDQLLANYFMQLAHVKDLLSYSAPPAPTYFSQPITDPGLGLDEIRRSDLATHRDRLQQITENPYGTTERADVQPDFGRRNRFLNHLLARFAEQFTEYSLMLYGALPKEPAARKLVQDKQRFLQNYPQLSSARGSAINYLRSWSSENCSGLEKRLRYKLGIVDPDERLYLVEHILLRPMAGDKQQHIPILAKPRLKDPYSLQISVVFADWPPRFQNPGFRAFVERTVREETPAHLIVYIHWFNKTTMKTFETAYEDWLARRRAYWSEELGV